MSGFIPYECLFDDLIAQLCLWKLEESDLGPCGRFPSQLPGQVT